MQEKQTPLGSVSVVVPCYRSADSIPLLVDALSSVLPSLGCASELVLVDDGSPDEGRTWQRIQALAETRSWIVGVRLMRNYGQHNALLCGIRAARGDVIVTMDDDLQHPASEIPKLLHKLAEGYDVVYGHPREERHGLLRDLASRVTKLVIQGSMGVEMARHVSAFRALRSEVREAFAGYSSPNVCIDVLLTWGTSRFAAVPVLHEPRRSGESGYTLGKLIRHAVNMITGFSVLPLQVASVVGLSSALFGCAVLAYVLGRYVLQGSTVQGFPFLASIIAIFSGAQLFALGVIGEYLGRVHFRMMDRPAYTVRDRLRPSAETAQESGRAEP